jgi:hypothetical protein
MEGKMAMNRTLRARLPLLDQQDIAAIQSVCGTPQA